MTKKTNFRVACEGDIEQVIAQFILLGKSKVKKKTISIRVPTEQLSNILLDNVNLAFRTNDIGDPQNFHVHIFIEKGSDE